MRISGGVLGGRRVKAAGAGVRPTQERVREALFSMLGARVGGCAFLDLFAGTGLVGLEAWSRGAAEVYWVEADARVHAALADDVARLCGEEVRRGRVLRGDVFTVIRRLAVARPFDLIFADPPYDFEEAVAVPTPGRGRGRRVRGADGGARTWEGLLEAVWAQGLLAGDGFFIVETDRLWRAPAGWELLKERSYGATRLYVLQPCGLRRSAGLGANVGEDVIANGGGGA